nr:nitroreductase [Paenibacillus beijingensis]
MELEQAIRERRSIGKVKPDAVERSVIEQLIEAATWAPNHYQTEPWKFIVMTGEGRRTLGRAYAAISDLGAADADDDERRQRLAREEAKALRAPVVIAAVYSPPAGSRAPQAEELAAVHAAVQNLLLSAHGHGLGAVWRSGDPMYHPRMKEAFGLEEQEELVGLIYIGYPDMEPLRSKRTDAKLKTVWLEE